MEVFSIDGRGFEQEVFTVSGDRGPTGVEYQSYVWALRDAMRNQPPGWNPLHPNTPIAARIYDSVYREIKLPVRHTLKLWVSIGRNLDYLHSVDAFFTLGLKKPFVYQGIDITSAPEEYHRAKEGVVLITKQDVKFDQLHEKGKIIAELLTVNWYDRAPDRLKKFLQKR